MGTQPESGSGPAAVAVGPGSDSRTWAAVGPMGQYLSACSQKPLTLPLFHPLLPPALHSSSTCTVFLLGLLYSPPLAFTDVRLHPPPLSTSSVCQSCGPDLCLHCLRRPCLLKPPWTHVCLDGEGYYEKKKYTYWIIDMTSNRENI